MALVGTYLDKLRCAPKSPKPCNLSRCLSVFFPNSRYVEEPARCAAPTFWCVFVLLERCVLLNQWELAVNLAQQHNFQQIEGWPRLQSLCWSLSSKHDYIPLGNSLLFLVDIKPKRILNNIY